jgi:thermostable 8-oxoguanine DNA glycosylase
MLPSETLVDPDDITQYDLSNSQLEAHLLFWVLAAGKNAKTAARALDKFLDLALFKINRCEMFEVTPHQRRAMLEAFFPFARIRELTSRQFDIGLMLKSCGAGCYNNKARTFKELAYSGFDLKTCSTDDLETIYGLGKKSSRCFIIHSRPNQKVAGLDTHVLSFLRDCGHPVPKSTPQSAKSYKRIERLFIDLCARLNEPIASVDLAIWKHYSTSESLPEMMSYFRSMCMKLSL